MANDQNEQLLEMLGEGLALKLLDIMSGSVYALWCFDCNRWSKIVEVDNRDPPLLVDTLVVCLSTDIARGLKCKYLLLPEHMEPRT